MQYMKTSKNANREGRKAHNSVLVLNFNSNINTCIFAFIFMYLFIYFLLLLLFLFNLYHFTTRILDSKFHLSKVSIFIA